MPPAYEGLFRSTESVRHDVYINCNIFDLLSLVFLRVLQRTQRESEQETEGIACCLQGQGKRTRARSIGYNDQAGSVSRACALHATLLLADQQPEPIPSRLLGIIIKLSISRCFYHVV